MGLHWPASQFPIHRKAFPNYTSLQFRLLVRRWAIEGAGNHFVAVLVGQLLERSEMVYSIPPSLTSQYRARRGRKKNDVVDAENVGRALLANPQLTPLHNTEQQRELQELTRAQRRLSEQLRANRGALQELMAESAVRKIIRASHCCFAETANSPGKADSGDNPRCNAIIVEASRRGSYCGWCLVGRNRRS